MNLPLKFLLLIWAGWMNRAQQNAIDYLKEENRILREQVGNKRLRLTNAHRVSIVHKRLMRTTLRSSSSSPNRLTSSTIRWHSSEAD